MKAQPVDSSAKARGVKLGRKTKIDRAPKARGDPPPRPRRRANRPMSPIWLSPEPARTAPATAQLSRSACASSITPAFEIIRPPSNAALTLLRAIDWACTFPGSPISAAGGMRSAFRRSARPAFCCPASISFGCGCPVINRCRSGSCC
jgi:hypothetical protein